VTKLRQRHEEDISLKGILKDKYIQNINLSSWVADDVLRNKHQQQGNSFFNCAITFGAIWSCLHKLFSNTNTHTHPHTFIESKYPLL
jgi:hypothetical protein